MRKKRTFLFLLLICLLTFITRPKLVTPSITLEKLLATLSQINLIFASEKQMQQSPQISAFSPNFEQTKVKYVKYEHFDK